MLQAAAGLCNPAIAVGTYGSAWIFVTELPSIQGFMSATDTGI